MNTYSNRMPAYAGMTLLLIAVLLLSSCGKQEWSGFVYPNKNNLAEDKNIGLFSSLEECRDNALEHISKNNYSNADYECGLNCDFSESKPYICEKTER